MNKFRPAGIWKGLRFLLYYVNWTFNDLEREIDNHRRRTSIDQNVQREKRRSILDKIRNTELDSEVPCKSTKTFTLKDTKSGTNATKIATKKSPTPPVKTINEDSSSKTKPITKKPSKKESQKPNTANKTLPPLKTTKSFNASTSQQSCSKITSQHTNKNKLENVEINAVKDCGDDFKPVSININIVLTDEILKDLTTNGITISINLAKE